MVCVFRAFVRLLQSTTKAYFLQLLQHRDVEVLCLVGCLLPQLHLYAVILSVVAKAQLVGSQAILGLVWWWKARNRRMRSKPCSTSHSKPFTNRRTPTGKTVLESRCPGSQPCDAGSIYLLFPLCFTPNPYTRVDTETMTSRLDELHGVHTLCNGDPLLPSFVVVVLTPG